MSGDDEVTADPVRGPLLGKARGHAEVITLSGLAANDVEQLIGSIPGMSSRDLAAGVWRPVPERVEGDQLPASKGLPAADGAS